MTTGKIRVKFWFIEKVQDEAKKYHMYIDIVDRTTDEHGMLQADEDGYYNVVADEIIAESEKAVKVRLATGLIDGSYKGWTTWIPKSVIA